MLDSNTGSVLTLIHQHHLQEEKFVVNQKTIQHIKQFQADYCFVSICGDYRSGKSFLLNSLFFNYSGFQTSSTTTSCTKGIKMWSEPIRHNNLCIWIIDTEGFGSIEKDSSYDGKIFLMNFLISNIILYNSFGAIDQNSINKLAMICRQARALDESTIESKLFWILRDFSLEMTDKNGKQLSSDQYLEECLKENHHQNKSQKEFLRTLFKQRHCFTLIRPLIDESKLNNLKQLSKIELREQFKSEISKLYNNIIQSTQCKMINSIRIGSHNIDILINDFVSTVNNGTIDCNLNCTYEKIMQHEHNMRKQAIITNLHSKIQALRKILPVQKHHINYLRTQVNQHISQMFKQFQMHSKGTELQLLKIQTNNEINNAIAAIQRQNKQKLQEQIKEYLHRQLIQLYPRLISLNLHGFQLKFHQIFTQLKDQYQNKYSPYLVEELFLQNNYNQFIEKQQKKVFFEIVKRWRANSKQFEQKTEQLKKNKKLLEQQLKKMKEQKARILKTLEQNKKQESKSIQRMKNDVQQTFKEQTRLIVSNFQQKIKTLNSQHDGQIIQLKVTLTTLQSQLSQLTTQFQYEKQSLLQKISLQKQRAELLNIKWQQSKNSIEIQQEQRKNTYENKIKIAQIKYNQLQTTLANQRKKYQIISQQRKTQENNILQELADKNYKIDCLTQQLIHLQDKYKQELQRILIEEKDIVCKTVTSKINQYQYKCRVYQAKLQQYAITASEKEFYQQRSQELDIDNRQLKALLEEEQDRNTLLQNHINKQDKELQQKQRIINSLKDQHLKEMSLLNQNLINNQHFMKESEQRQMQEIEWYKCKLQNALKDQSYDLNHKYQESLENYKAILQQKFQKERWQLKEIIKNNYDEVENLKISIITLNSQMQKIYQILTRVLIDYQNFHKVEGESRRTSLRNSSHLSDIAESPQEEFSEKLTSAFKHQRISKSTQFIAQEIEQIFASLKEEIVLLTKQRMSIKQEIKTNMQEFDSFERVINKVKQQNKHYKAELQQLRRKLCPFESATKELQTIKQKYESLQKQATQLKRQIDLKQQLFISKDENYKQNTIMYKDAISNLTEQTKILSSKLRQLTEIHQDCQSQLQRFKIWESQVKNKPIYPQQQVQMSAEKMKDLQNQIKKLAKKLQESKIQKLQKGAKRQVNLYSSILHENRMSQIEALRTENEQLYRKLQQKQDLQVKSIEQKKHSKQRQMEHEESRYSSLKEEYQLYKKKSKETITMLQSKIDIYKEENKQLKQEYKQLEGTIVQKYQFNKKVIEQQNEQLKREKQSLSQYYSKKIQSLQENLNNKAYDADKRIAQADLRFEQYRDELQKEHNRIILQGERHRLKYQHLLKVNGELIKEIESLKSKAHQITIKQKYKSKISSLFDD